MADIEPLVWSASITDSSFRPTPSFLRQWRTMTVAVNAVQDDVALISDTHKVSYAATLTAAKALFAAGVVLANGTVIVLAGNATSGDGAGGSYAYAASDTTTTYTVDAIGFVDNQGRRFKRVGPNTLYVAAGTAALPAITFVADPNTGLYNVSADVLGVAVGGTLVASFTTTGPIFTNRSIFGVAAEACSTSGVLAAGVGLSIGVNPGGGGWSGIVIATQSDAANANVRTHTIYSVIARGSSATFASLATGNGSGGGSSFAMSCSGNGVIVLTNNSGASVNAEISYFGSLST